MGEIIDGRLLADKMQARLKEEVEAIVASGGTRPGLVVIQVGANPASSVYVRNKENSAIKVGLHSQVDRLGAETTETELLNLIEEYNNDPKFHGILVQLPLPSHINEDKILDAIHPDKDVDGFHPVNMGNLFVGTPTKIPCTPYGIMKMFEAYNIDLNGKNAVVIGRSNIVGKPIGALMMAENATVTTAHSRTKDLAKVAAQADILVVAIGRAKMVDASFVKEGAVVIDVGMNHDENGKLCGDVDFASVEPKASYITPVPKGVGPMTITMLITQAVETALGRKIDFTGILG
ncbi:MAG: bifunctional methylenetetrahydrofolate dehydrogenase/methenyltetrahydrofolate cyclohydrolase FolD [Lactobacillales bacterium]|jgi:methylenetetrahydrofolate dehydrogenase (NADP+)/methenyltetrahydrofolate cyclohydrolase|nr:bifunctional methylenetetrahydrofolate dehydrogenase/methenyltetrahydrofolate cyclohydrolase FolD [Lactobacillales bacterium]